MNQRIIMSMTVILCACLCITSQAQEQESKNFYLDVHHLEPGSVSYSDVLNAHIKDLEKQAEHGVEFLKFWVAENEGHVYCLSMASDASDVVTTHNEAHGLTPSSIEAVVAGDQAQYSGNGSLFLDIHDLGPGNVTADAVADAHVKDMEEQGHHHVNFINYWVDEARGKVYCLSEAPSQDAVISTHEKAHGLIPVKVMEVKQGQ